ncbi:MAG: outer membrane beta-barrel protein [Myxococcaceae bacterium]|nr:outer membrane beta-barrel protein [Myxococcaceae bacterium]
MLKRAWLSLLTAVCMASSVALADEVDLTSEKTDGHAKSSHATFEPSLGVVFNLQNIFQNAGVLSGFNGGIGVLLPLNANLWLRPTVSLRRTSDPAVVTTTTTTANDMTTVTHSLTRPSPTSTFGITLGADLLRRLLDGDLAPYVGAGLMFDISTQNTFWRDDVSVMNQVSVRDDTSTSFGFGARGILGVGWRLYPHFMIFAEYAVNLTFVSANSTNTSTTVTNMGMSPVSATSSASSVRVFEFATGLSQGASLGLAAFF